MRSVCACICLQTTHPSSVVGRAQAPPPRRSADLKLAVASLFFDFAYIKFNASKMKCCASELPEWGGPATVSLGLMASMLFLATGNSGCYRLVVALDWTISATCSTGCSR